MGAPGVGGRSDAYVDDLDELVAALRQDPVNVQQVRGNGHTTQVDAELTEIVAASDVPMYVALLDDLPDLAVEDPADDLAVRLQAQLGKDAVYVIAVGDRSTSFHYDGVDADLEGEVYSGLSATYREDGAAYPSDAGRAAIIASIVASDDHTVSESAVRTYTESPTWTAAMYDPRDEVYLPSEVAGLSLFMGGFVALVAWRLTRTWALRSVTPAPAPTPRKHRTSVRPTSRARPAPVTRDLGPDLEEVRRDATSTLDKLAAELARHPAGPGVDDALGCRVAAEAVLGSDDPLDVVGALVLARTGRRLLDDPERPYRPCFLNPLHGLGYVETAAPVGGDGSVRVPVCSECSKAAGSRRALEPLLERPRGWIARDPRPYYEGDTVWARTGFGAFDHELWRRVTEERS